MDILRPTLIRIGNRCYRKNPVISEKSDGAETKRNIVVEEDVYEDEVCDVFTNIQETNRGYTLRMDVPSVLFSVIVGKKGETKKKIEEETSTQILIPKQGQQEQEIVIQGRERRGVLSAKTRVEVLLDSARSRQPFTHFLSFPVSSDAVTLQFLQFKEAVVSVCALDRGIDETIFQNVNKLHLTIGTLTLLNEIEVSTAVELLHESSQYIRETFLKDGPLHVHFRGVEYMNDDPAEVDVLYAKVHLDKNANRLQDLSDSLVQQFIQAGFMQRQYDNVKLHMTIMNSLMRRDTETKMAPEDRESFDATNILSLFTDYEFGSQTLGSLHISQRYSTAADGYYKNATKLELSA